MLASRSRSCPQSSLEVQPAQPHVAHVHVAPLFTNTPLGVPAPLGATLQLVRAPVFHPRSWLLAAVVAEGRALMG